MEAPTAFGLFAVTAMLVCYALEHKSGGMSLVSLGHVSLDRFTASFKARGRSA